MSYPDVVFNLEVEVIGSESKPGDLFAGFWRLLEAHEKLIGASCRLFDTVVFSVESRIVNVEDLFNPQCYPREYCEIRASFGLFREGHGIKVDSESCQLRVAFSQDTWKIRLELRWNPAFFLGAENLSIDRERYFRPILYKRYMWNTNGMVEGEVTMKDPWNYCQLFNARLAQETMAYFWSFAHSRGSWEADAVVYWRPGTAHGSYSFIS